MKKIIIGILIFVGICIIVLVALYLSVFSHPTITTKDFEKCSNTPVSYKYLIKLNVFQAKEVDGSIVYALDKDTRKVIDSTLIILSFKKDTLKLSPSYEFKKGLSTEHNWKIIFKERIGADTPEYLLITDIKTKGIGRSSMTHERLVCYIYEWKVNGKRYISNDFENGNQEFILGED